MKRAFGAIAATVLLVQGGAAAAPPPAATLVAFARLPAATFVKGPTAGAHQGPGALPGHAGPYAGKQPVQGFSGAVADGGGRYTVLVDNGYGAIDTSADHRLTLYQATPRWGTPGKPGTVAVGRATLLRDPDRKLPWTITHQFTADRPLTGADLDPESIVRAPDGTYWLGDEFGPFLVHVAADGRVLDAPYDLPGVRSRQNPFSEETASLRILNALRAHGEAHGQARPIALSPWFPLITGEGARPIVGLGMLHTAGFAVVPWTVNTRPEMDALLAAKVDGLISDRPDLLRQAIAAFDADGDGRPGDYLDADGNVDAARFDAEGHRGARDLRPESTLPAFEAALDLGMTTLETDVGVSKDGVPLLSHDPHLEPAKTRRLDGRPMPGGTGPAIRAHDAAYLQATFDRGVTLEDRPLQTLDPAASPVAGAFAAARGLRGPHALLSLPQLFDFVAYYEAHYRTGAGRAHPEARRRAAAAARVRFDIETKSSPEWEREGLVPDPAAFVKTIGGVVSQTPWEARTTIQSFDYRTLLAAQEAYPRLGTAFLLEDALPFGMRGPGAPAAGLPATAPAWPWRVTGAIHPLNAQRSGGYESLGASPDGRWLYALMEKPLTDAAPGMLRLDEFDTRERRWTGRTWTYPWDQDAHSVADLAMVNATQGLAIERDDGEGAQAKLKRLYLITLGAPGTVVKKELVADLMAIADPRRLGGGGTTFAMPFWTIEAVVPLDARHVLILNDNNYPFSGGRRAGVPDDDEFAVLELPKPLPLPAGFKPVRWR